MQVQTQQHGKFGARTGICSIGTQSEVITISGNNYVRESIYVDGEETRVEYSLAPRNAGEGVMDWMSIALQVTTVSATSTIVGYAIGSLVA